VMKTLCQPGLAGAVDKVAAPDAWPDAEAEGADARRAKTKAEAARELRAELLAWRAAFEAREGRAPAREDLAADAHARDLMAQFSQARGWAEEETDAGQ